MYVALGHKSDSVLLKLTYSQTALAENMRPNHVVQSAHADNDWGAPSDDDSRDPTLEELRQEAGEDDEDDAEYCEARRAGRGAVPRRGRGRGAAVSSRPEQALSRDPTVSVLLDMCTRDTDSIHNVSSCRQPRTSLTLSFQMLGLSSTLSAARSRHLSQPFPQIRLSAICSIRSLFPLQCLDPFLPHCSTMVRYLLCHILFPKRCPHPPYLRQLLALPSPILAQPLLRPTTRQPRNGRLLMHCQGTKLSVVSVVHGRRTPQMRRGRGTSTTSQMRCCTKLCVTPLAFCKSASRLKCHSRRQTSVKTLPRRCTPMS